jgi:virginiamycin B lyase
MHVTPFACVVVTAFTLTLATATAQVTRQDYPLPPGTYPHDVAVAPDGSVVWYSEQNVGALGKVDPRTGKVTLLPLGPGSAPHGVIAGPDGAAWLTDSGANAIVRVDPKTDEIKRFPMPAGTPNINLNTAAFNSPTTLWFTGNNGFYGKVDITTGTVQVFEAPRGRGPYGITATPDGTVYYASLTGNHIARVDPRTGAATVLEPPTAGQGARRVWSDSKGSVWVAEWNSGNVSRYDPASNTWKVWRLPGKEPGPYAVYVDDRDDVWLSDWGDNAIVRFDPRTETFEAFPSPRKDSNVRQMLGRPGEVWVAESGTAHLVVFRTRAR